MVANISKEKFEPMRLSQVPVHQKNFDADMGGVEFTRTDIVSRMGLRFRTYMRMNLASKKNWDRWDFDPTYTGYQASG